MSKVKSIVPDKRKHNKPRYDDWICSICCNHNYSFRVECNRCHMQKRDSHACERYWVDSVLSDGCRLAYTSDCRETEFPHAEFVDMDEWKGGGQLEDGRDQPYNAHVKWIQRILS